MRYTYPFNIDPEQLKIIQEDILGFIEKNNIVNKRGYTMSLTQLKELPRTNDFINSVSKVRLNLTVPAKLFFTPPNDVLLPHIDPKYGSSIALNIPIANTANTSFIYYTTDPSNIESRQINLYGLSSTALVPKDSSLLKEIERIELTTPHLVRTDVFHSVVNNNDTTRIIISFRWISASNDFECYV